MAMSMVLDRVLITSNPATGAEVGRVTSMDPDRMGATIARARSVQSEWAKRSWRERQAVLIRWWKILSRDAGTWADLIRDEVGKPRAEALAGDVVSTLDGIRWTVKQGGRALDEQKIGPGWQRWLLMPTGWLGWTPLGVVGMIGTWNYPLYLNAPPIAQALAAGNAVVWKPSELAVRTGQRIQQSLEEAGVPAGLVTAVYGGGEVGKALVESEIDKLLFTGGVESGRRVLAGLGARGVPAVAELSGFDPAIILPDAPRRSTVRALTWAAFVGCGQTCVAVKRIYVVGDADPWAEAFAAQARDLKVGDPAESDCDVGPMITSAARDRFDRMIQEAVRAGARVLAGGTTLAGPGWFYAPTVLEAETPEPEAALAGTFGPVVLVRGVPDANAAVEAANSSSFGLGASVWGRRRGAARAVARRLQAGVVSVNEAVTPTAHAAAPFGGCKASGYGRTHGAFGLREFACPQVLFDRRPGGFRPQLFPYSRSGTMERFLAFYCGMFHPRA
jgi:acyl-CoA reductase-like NAD-dependent aldehyde dehydrogenase